MAVTHEDTVRRFEGTLVSARRATAAFHAEANAALASLRARLALVPVEEPGAEEQAGEERSEPSPPPQLQLAEPRSGPTSFIQLLLGCAAINYKRLTDHVPEAANGLAGAPQAGAGDLRSRRLPAMGPIDRFKAALARAVDPALGASASTWSYIVCVN
jgi:hypothetical protein